MSCTMHMLNFCLFFFCQCVFCKSGLRLLQIIRSQPEKLGVQREKGIFLPLCPWGQDRERECSKSAKASSKPGFSSPSWSTCGITAAGTELPFAVPYCGGHCGCKYNHHVSLAKRNQIFFPCQAAQCFLGRLGPSFSGAKRKHNWSKAVLKIPFHLTGIGSGMVMWQNSHQWDLWEVCWETSGRLHFLSKKFTK